MHCDLGISVKQWRKCLCFQFMKQKVATSSPSPRKPVILVLVIFRKFWNNLHQSWQWCFRLFNHEIYWPVSFKCISQTLAPPLSSWCCPHFLSAHLDNWTGWCQHIHRSAPPGQARTGQWRGIRKQIQTFEALAQLVTHNESAFTLSLL